MGRFKDNILKDKKFLREVAITLIVGIIVNALCFLMPFVVHAETTELPYITSNNPYYNESEVNNILDAIHQKYPDDELENIIVFLGSESLWWDYSTYIPAKTYFVYNLSGFTYASTWGQFGTQIVPNAGNFNLYGDDYIDVSLDGVTRYVVTFGGNIYPTYNDLHLKIDKLSGGNTRRFFSDYSNVIHVENAKFNFDYLQNYPVYCNNSFYTSDSSGNAITFLTYGVSEPIIGEFTDLPSLDELLDNISNSFTGGSSGTSNTPDQNKTDIQNFADFFNNLQSSINSNLNNFGQNIKSWFDNLQKKLTDVANSISSNIWNGFATLMQNIKDFLSPKLDYIIEKFNYITEEPDSEQIIDFIESTSIYSDISSINSSVTTFGSSFTGVSEPDDYTLTFHIEDIDILNQSQPFVLHLNILNPVKSTIRAMLWVIVSYGLFISVIDSLPNYINGGGGEDD